MADRRISIRITVENAQAVQATQQQTRAVNDLNTVTDRHTHLQAGLTNSFIKGNLAARAISVSYLTLRDSVRFLVAETAQLELNFARTAAVTGNTATEMARLQAQVFALSRTTAASTNDIAKTALELSKLGFAGKDLEAVLGGVAALSSILGDSLEATGQLVGGVVNAFNLSSEEAAQVADKLFVATGKSATNVEGFKVAFSLASTAAQDAGISFEEFSAAVAALSNQGIRASTIGTGLRNFIGELSKEGSKAQKVLGGSIEELGLLGAIERLSTLQLKPGSLIELFGKPGSPVASGLQNAREQYIGFVEDINNSQGALENGKKVINDTLISQVQLLKNAFIELFSVSTSGIASNWTKFLSETATRVQNLTDKFKLQSEAMEFYRKLEAEGRDPAKAVGMSSSKQDVTREEFIEAYKKHKLLADQQKFRQGEFSDPRDEQAAMRAAMKSTPVPKIDPKLKDKVPGMGALEEDEKIKRYKVSAYPQIDRRIAGREDELNAKEDAAALEKRTKIVNEYIEQYQKLKAATDEFNMSVSYGFTASTIAVDGMNASINALAGSLVGLQEWGDAFKSVLQQIAAQIIATVIKLMIFKAITSALGIGTGGAGFVATGGLTDVFLKGLGGQAAPKMPLGPGFASGTDQIVRQPTAFIAGEAGAERLRVTPRAKMHSGSSEGGSTIVIQGDVYDYERFARKVKEAQGSNRSNFV